MTEFIKRFVCDTEEKTKLLASKIANVCKKGDVFALYGTLGAGKSTFSRHFIQSLVGNIDVPSPTFTLVQVYETNDFEIYHYDMYRLKSENEAYELGIEEAFYGAVNLIEWPEKIDKLLPKKIWKINILSQNNSRIFEFVVNEDEKIKRLLEIEFE